MKKHLYLLLLLLPIVAACEDEYVTKNDFPIIRTLEPTDIDETGVTFHGELIQRGRKINSTFGFCWATDSISLSNGMPNKVRVEKEVQPGIYTMRINSSLRKGVKYYIKAFAKCESLTVYGNTKIFTSKGSSN